MMVQRLMLVLMWVIGFSLCAVLQTWQANWQGGRNNSDNILEVVLGESRRMFANHFFIKSDVYFHSGYYPSIFDETGGAREVHIAQDAGAMEETHHAEDEDSGRHRAKAGTNAAPETKTDTDKQPDGSKAETHAGKSEHKEEHDFMGPPRDWIDAFGRSFYPSHHTHLDEGRKGVESEILPWIRVSTELDPHRVETYTTAAYWLRQHLGKAKEAREFLLEGWRQNPDSCEIIFELGRVYYENDKDLVRARNLWELGIRKWQQIEAPKKEPNLFVYEQLAGQMAKLEEDEHHFDKALIYLDLLKRLSPHPEVVEAEIQQIRQKAGKN